MMTPWMWKKTSMAIDSLPMSLMVITTVRDKQLDGAIAVVYQSLACLLPLNKSRHRTGYLFAEFHLIEIGTSLI